MRSLRRGNGQGVEELVRRGHGWGRGQVVC